METFTPSLNWSDELITSLVWVVKAWAIEQTPAGARLQLDLAASARVRSEK